MSTSRKTPGGTTRRGFLSGAVAAGGAALAAKSIHPAAAADPANQPPNVADWSRYLGEGVDVYPYGQPSKFESDDSSKSHV